MSYFFHMHVDIFQTLVAGTLSGRADGHPLPGVRRWRLMAQNPGWTDRSRWGEGCVVYKIGLN